LEQAVPHSSRFISSIATCQLAASDAPAIRDAELKALGADFLRERRVFKEQRLSDSSDGGGESSIHSLGTSAMSSQKVPFSETF